MAEPPSSWWSKGTVAVVTGGNKGLGLEIVRQLAEHGLTVILTARDPSRGQAAVDGLKAKGLHSVGFHPLDVRSSESAKNLAEWLNKEFGGIDILVNNAGATTYDNTYENPYKLASDIVDTNYRGVKNVTEALLPLLRASTAGARVVNVSSRSGLYERLTSDSLKLKFRHEEHYSQEMLDSLVAKYLTDVKEGRAVEEGWLPLDIIQSPMYSESKMFLNVYTTILAKSLATSQPECHRIFVVNYCPGAVQTDMSHNAIEAGLKMHEWVPVKTVAEGADTGIWLALLPKEEMVAKHGKLFQNREEYPFGLSFSFV